MTIQELTKAIQDMTETLDRLACGDAGLLDNDANADDVAELLSAVSELVEVVEDDLGTRLTRAGHCQIEDMTARWFADAEKALTVRG